MTTVAPLALIVAMARGRIIGKGGGIPWHVPEDLRHFKASTMGHAIVMGRKTWDSIGRALPGRTSVVVSRGDVDLPPGVLLARTIDEAIAAARRLDPEPFVVGGQQLYEATLPEATRLLVTELDLEVEGGDVRFPPIPQTFREASRTPGSSPGVVFVEYVRREEAAGAAGSARE